MTKTYLLLSAILLISLDCYSQQNAGLEFKQTVINNGIGLGSVIAAVASWERNKSILWAIIHGILGWLYVGYFVITRNPGERK